MVNKENIWKFNDEEWKVHVDNISLSKKLSSNFGLVRSTIYYENGRLDEETAWDFIVPNKQIDKVKSDKGKDKYRKIQKEYIREFSKHTNNLTLVLTFQNLLVDAKMQIVKKLNSVKGLTDTFIKTDNGFKVTNPEGYVAIDRVSGGAVKLVDRMEFSFNNFTAIKAWDK